MEDVESILLGKPGVAAQASQMNDSASHNGPDYEAHPKSWSYRGRARRQEYWSTILIFFGLVLVVAIPFTILCATMFTDYIVRIYGPIAIVVIAYLVWVLFTMPVSVRRLHDRDMSGWWMLWFWLLESIPVVGFGVGIAQFVIMGCHDGIPGPNRYGPDPKGRNFIQPSNVPMHAGLVKSVAPEERIRKFKAMMDDGIISKAEYEEIRTKLLAEI